ncbi:MAG: HTTM domain-containing protein [Bacteroidetes bacterium]|nr:HTTM domain-containing protein [Bacteroidota bacterium]
MLSRFQNWLFTPVDNAGLVAFRVLYGLILAAEAFGALATGWVTKIFVKTEFTIGFIDFQWLADLLHGPIMYLYYAILGVLGLMIAFGYKYRLATLGFFVMWWAVYLSQKSHYNNHYYLMVVLTGLMFFIDCNRFFSIDSKQGKVEKSNQSPRWNYFIIIALLLIVYTYASINKIYPDWLEGRTIPFWFKDKADYLIIGPVLQNETVQWCVIYGGILFDGLIIPALIWKRTRWLAVAASIFFHIFNSIVFQIGVFPYMMIATLVLFLRPEDIRKRIFKKSEAGIKPRDFSVNKPVFWTIMVFLLINIILPVRHHFIKGDVFYTEEGHRMSWRMMLRSKRGNGRLKIVDLKTNKDIIYPIKNHLRPHQYKALITQPDMVYSMVQKMKTHLAKDGYDSVAIYWGVTMSLNRGSFHEIIPDTVNLAKVEWNHFRHNEWILSPPKKP